MKDEKDGPEWIRKGECNECGDCCRQGTNLLSIAIPIKDVVYGRIRFGEPLVEIPGGGAAVFQIRGPILMVCPKLEGDRCSIQGEKPETCRDSPVTPDDIEGLTRCSYWFVHRETGEIRGTPVL